jgi:hypothetical protein
MSSSTTPSFSSFSFPDSDEEDQVLSEQEKEVEDEKDKMIKNTKEEEKAKLEDIPKEKGKEKEKEEKSDVLRVAEYSREYCVFFLGLFFLFLKIVFFSDL